MQRDDLNCMSKFWLCKTFLFFPLSREALLFSHHNQAWQRLTGVAQPVSESAWKHSPPEFLWQLQTKSFSWTGFKSLSPGCQRWEQSLRTRGAHQQQSGASTQYQQHQEFAPEHGSSPNQILTAKPVQKLQWDSIWLSAGMFTSNCSTCWKAADCFSAGNNYDYRQQHYYIYLKYKHTQRHTYRCINTSLYRMSAVHLPHPWSHLMLIKHFFFPGLLKLWSFLTHSPGKRCQLTLTRVSILFRPWSN